MRIMQHYMREKKLVKVYAISTHPNIKKEELSKRNFVLGGVPTLVEFENHKVINFYFDDKEIIDFFGKRYSTTR